MSTKSGLKTCLKPLLESFALDHNASKAKHFRSVLQGQPLGFDTKYLALGDRNMQVRFSLKVVWES